MIVDAERLMALAAVPLDLVRAPFTLPGSRILVFAAGTGVSVCTAEYEKDLDACRAIDVLIVYDQSGAVAPVTVVEPHRIVFGDEVATLCFDGPDALSIGGAPGAVVEWSAPGGAAQRHPCGPALMLEVGSGRALTVRPHGHHARSSEASRMLWLDWFAKCPVVRADLQAMAAFCWWVLGANIITVPGLDDARPVVPSKIGYVGLWQWDAYFIALGLRHGDPELAREQLDVAFRFATPDGQLPDVVHEGGVLASSDDLVPADRDRLRRAGSAIADPTSPIPLTKPPLSAWALRKVLDASPRTPELDAWARHQFEIIRASQEWWFARSDLDGDGMPEYGHPYSSGLDDSPIFDGPLPTTAPDLGAYLVTQDLELARFAEEFGDVDPTSFRERAARTRDRLIEMWMPERAMFLARAAGTTVSSDAITGLMPLLTGTLPGEVAAALVAAIQDPTRYASTWALPTVALSDPDFSPTRMWRGPVWINTNHLVAEGLERSGYPELARELRERTVALVIHGGGPHEYFNPLTGEKAPTATTSFGWSAALFVDLAVQLSR